MSVTLALSAIVPLKKNALTKTTQLFSAFLTVSQLKLLQAVMQSKAAATVSCRRAAGDRLKTFDSKLGIQPLFLHYHYEFPCKH